MRNFNFNIASFFNNSNSNGMFGGFNLCDYASLKNGSYGKLMKSYYNEQNKTSVSEKTSVNKTKKELDTDKTGLAQMKKEADGLKNAADALNKEELWKTANGEDSQDKIVSAVKSFTKEYNDVLSQSAKVNSKDVSQSSRYMQSMTNTMSKALSKIGVTVGTDGKLSVDEDALKKANTSSVKAMFSGVASYGQQMGDKGSEISRATIMNSSMYTNNGQFNSTLASTYNDWF